MTALSRSPALQRMHYVALVAFSLLGSPAIAEQDGHIMSLRALYKVAVLERGDAVNVAMGKAQEILERAPGDGLARVYKGSLLTMMGGDAMLPWNKLRYVNEGIDLMDNAVGAVGVATHHDKTAGAEALMVAAFTNSRLPRMFKRDAIARQQIAELITHRAFGTLDDDLRVQALEIAASYAKADGDGARFGELSTQAAKLKATTVGNKRQ